MNPSQRIVFNTIATYARSVLGAGLALFSTRWILSALGQTDYGIFSIIGSLIVFITFLNTAMAGSASRHFAYAIGQGNPGEIKNWFNASFNIHVYLAFILTLIGWPVGDYIIVHLLNIPAERIYICLWVFRISLISSFIGILSIPFIAMFNAKQHITELAVWNMFQSILVFILAWFLTRAPGDRLVVYAAGMTIITIFVQLVLVLRAVIVFNECRFSSHRWFDKYRFKKLFVFAIWDLIGWLGQVVRNQGSAIMLNIFFGPKVNAAYGIANQVSTQTGQLSSAMIGAFLPEITTSEGRGDRSRMLSLALKTSKYGTILIMLFAIPLMIEMDYILKLWLREPPPYTGLLCQLILVMFLIDRLNTGYWFATYAYGKIAGYQTIFGVCLILTLPIAWLFLKLGYSPTSVGVAFVITVVISSLGRVLWVRHLFGIAVTKWLMTVVVPCAIVALATTIAALVPQWVLPTSFIRLTVVFVSGIAISIITTWCVALDDSDRIFIVNNMKNILKKVRLAKG